MERKNQVFSERLAALMQATKTRQVHLSKVLGVSKSTVGLWTLGATLPNADAITHIAIHFDTSADWLLGLTDNPHREPQDDSTAALYSAALDKWGADAQTAMCVEEMSELTKELCKWKRGKDNFNEIAEEIADVEIMLEQMKLLHKASALVETVKVYKRSRLRERVNQNDCN
jgi:Bacteriophage CI repressor helix-turn-helix domain.